MSKFFLIAVMLSCFACGKSNSSDSPAALGDGTYAVTGPVCKSTGESPIYPNATSSAALYEFTDSTYTLNVSGGTAEQVFTDADCTLKIMRELSANTESYFGLREKKTTTSSPENCELTVIHDDTTFPFTSTTPILASSGENSVEILFNVESSGENAWTLSSRDESPDNKAWSAFGCADPDQIVYSLSKQ